MNDPILLMKWQNLQKKLADSFGKRPDMNAVLFLIGIQELGKGFREFSKEEKQDLMHIATCKLMEPLGYYSFEGLDEDGWPHYKNLNALPTLNLKEQETLMKIQAIEYFETLFDLD
ncbi:MAG TPA: hypothetical protein VL947_03480 [Cytophagales bacterium]|nr:hypothetical protein [Cytophagales bacterium]